MLFDKRDSFQKASRIFSDYKFALAGWWLVDIEPYIFIKYGISICACKII